MACVSSLTGLKLTHSTAISRADELAWLAALCLLASTLLSYIVIRNEPKTRTIARVAELLLFLSVLMLGRLY